LLDSLLQEILKPAGDAFLQCLGNQWRAEIETKT